MGRAPCCSKVGLHRGPWTTREDALLTSYIQCNGEGNWRSLPKKAGLLRCGKSCRLRWMNYLRPDIKRGNIGPDEEDLIIRLHSLLGNRWSLIAGRLPGRTDNEIKNYWNSHLSKKLKKQGIQVRECSKSSSSRRSKSLSSSHTKSDHDRKAIKKMIDLGEEDKMKNLKTKIHAPKPVRLAPALRIDIDQAAETSQGSEDDQRHLSWPDINDEDDYGFANCGNGEFQNELLDRAYREYSELLNMDEGSQLPLFDFTDYSW